MSHQTFYAIVKADKVTTRFMEIRYFSIWKQHYLAVYFTLGWLNWPFCFIVKIFTAMKKTHVFIQQYVVHL